MAQRTGAERFLASIAKAAGAGVLLALAVVALLLAGCGGGDDSSGQAASTAAQAQVSGQSGDASDPASGGGKGATGPANAEGKAAGEAAAPGEGGGGESSSQGQKHGQRIAPPKGPREQAPTPLQVNNATVADMSLRSPAIVAANGNPGTLAATYTCDGKDSWPELSWGGVPAGTAELVLYAMNVQPVEEQLFVDWAVAGLDPGLTGVEAGKLPKGAIVGTNGFGKRGYSICPTGSGEIYMFAVYALPTRLAPPKGFDAREFRKQILDASGNVGLLPAVYARG